MFRFRKHTHNMNPSHLFEILLSLDISLFTAPYFELITNTRSTMCCDFNPLGIKAMLRSFQLDHSSQRLATTRTTLVFDLKVFCFVESSIKSIRLMVSIIYNYDVIITPSSFCCCCDKSTSIIRGKFINTLSFFLCFVHRIVIGFIIIIMNLHSAFL